ncbi:MAG: hypothetical protein ABWZ19_09125 [Hyphomicrobium sp.]
MKISRLILVGAFVLGATAAAEAATTAPRLHAPGVATHTATEDAKDKKKVSHKAHKQKTAQAHKVKKVKKSKKG